MSRSQGSMMCFLKQHIEISTEYITVWPLGQAAKTSPSHGENGSSILPGVTSRQGRHPNLGCRQHKSEPYHTMVRFGFVFILFSSRQGRHPNLGCRQHKSEPYHTMVGFGFFTSFQTFIQSNGQRLRVHYRCVQRQDLKLRKKAGLNTIPKATGLLQLLATAYAFDILCPCGE